MTIEEKVNSLRFEPVCEIGSRGSVTQRCKTEYRNVIITQDTYYPWSPFEKVWDTVYVWLQLPTGYTLPDGWREEDVYNDEGFFTPAISRSDDFEGILTETIKFIDYYYENKTN
jgi:hypothetical protein